MSIHWRLVLWLNVEGSLAPRVPIGMRGALNVERGKRRRKLGRMKGRTPVSTGGRDQWHVEYCVELYVTAEQIQRMRGTRDRALEDENALIALIPSKPRSCPDESLFFGQIKGRLQGGAARRIATAQPWRPSRSKSVSLKKMWSRRCSLIRTRPHSTPAASSATR